MIHFSFSVPRKTITIQGTGTLEKGITLLTGPSGSGKSTIIKVMAGLLRPAEGFIHCDGTTWMDIEKDVYLKPQKRHVGYMPQGNVVFPHMTVKDNITYSKKGDKEHYDTIIDRLGLRSYEHKKASSLSGGEQQRVALGRSLYARPSILLLDEPLSALDPVLRDSVGRDIQRAIAEWRIPCLWVTHDGTHLQDHECVRWTIEKGQLRTE